MVKIGISEYNCHHTLTQKSGCGENQYQSQTFQYHLRWNFDTRPLSLFAPKSSVFGLVEAIDSSLTLLLSLYHYDGWSFKVWIGLYCVSPSPHSVFSLSVGMKFRCKTTITFCTKINGLIESDDNRLIRRLSNYKHDGWLYKARI